MNFQLQSLAMRAALPEACPAREGGSLFLQKQVVLGKTVENRDRT